MDLVAWLLGDRAPNYPVWCQSGGPTYTVEALRAQIAQVEGAAITRIATDDPWHCLVQVLGTIAAGRVAWPYAGSIPDRSNADLHPDTCLILSTSGSTGTPRRVMLGATGIAHNVDAILRYLPLTPGQRVGLLTPLHYSFGLIGQCFTALRAGACLVSLTPGPWIARQAQEMCAAQVTAFSAVPTVWTRLAEAPKRPRLQVIASAGAHLSSQLVKRLAVAFPGARLFNQYGQTEASPRLCATEVHPGEGHPGLVGPPIAGVSVTVYGEHGQPMPTGEVGQLVFRTPAVMLGYWGDPAATATTLTARGLEVGDLGLIDAEGAVHVRGRQDDLIKVGGERISLLSIQARIEAVPGVEACAVLVQPDPLFGARPVAFVVAPNLDSKYIMAQLRNSPPATRPVRIITLDALPIQSNGKIEQAALRRLLEA